MAREPQSLTEACIEYTIAQYTRRAECGGGTLRTPLEYAITSMSFCPDALTSDGSTRTLDSVLECAKAWRDFPCEQQLQGLVPACTTPGTRATGELCLYGSQCASGRCSRPDSCGECATVVGAGEACDDLLVRCERGLSCSGGLCEAGPEFDAVPHTRALGDVCNVDPECPENAVCAVEADGVWRCVALVPPGEACELNAQCEPEAYCSTDRVCRPKPAEGAPCGTRIDGNNVCGEDLVCDSSASGGRVCVIYSLAQPCEEGGLRCPPGDSCCTAADCAARRCLHVLFPGEPCGDADSQCHPGSECLGGVCEAIDSQGLFEQACGL